MILTNKVLRRKLKDAIKMIPDTSGRITTTAFNAKVTVIENKKPDITNLSTKAALNTKASETENRIHDTSNFIKLKNSTD